MNDRPSTLRPLLGLFVCLTAAGLFASGCATSQRTLEDSPTEALVLSSANDQYRLGDALVLNARLEWWGDTPPPAWLLDADALEFWLANPDTTLRRVWPVAPESDMTMGDITSTDGYTPERTFVFTNATRNAGEFTLVAKWHTAPESTTGEPPLSHWSRPLAFTVSPERAFERRADGLISQADAESLARRALNLTGQVPCRSVLIDSNYGLHDWIVTFPDGESPPQTVVINPYLGTIRSRNRVNSL